SGVSRAASEEANKMAIAHLMSESPLGETMRERLRETVKLQRIEYDAHDVELGYNYDGGAVVADGTARLPRDPMGRNYVQTSRPGSRLPHAWLTRDGEPVSTHDLVGSAGGYVLLTGGAAEEWESAAKAASTEHDMDLRVVSIREGGCYQDSQGDWTRVRGIDASGAILVRPDNFVAWRAATAGPDSTAALCAAVANIIG